MTTFGQTRAEAADDERVNFSLVLGGPLYQLLRRSHLADTALHLVRRRIVASVLVAWVPLLLLSALDGNLWQGDVKVPLLKDLEAHTRFLLALPLLIIAELVVHQRMRPLVQQFLERNLIAPSDQPRFDAIVQSAKQLRNSAMIEVCLIAAVYLIGILLVWRYNMAQSTSTWYATPSSSGSTLTRAGIWYGYISLPIFQFLLVRWYFRLFIWARLLWQVSRINLQLVPTHPDRAGGLGFLPTNVYAFVPLLMAHGALLLGLIGNRVFFLGAKLQDFIFEIGTLTAFLLCAVLGPLLVFAPQLTASRRDGLREYGALAERYVRDFDDKWLRGNASGEPLMGSGDIQSLADLGNSYEIIRTMRPAPFGHEAILHLAIATLLPVAPLLLTVMPLEELLKSLLGILF
jgi:hypothetical protein